MTDLQQRKSKLTFAVNSMIREKGKLRQVVLSPYPGHLEVRLKGCRRSLNVSYEWIYQQACRLEAEKLRAERKAARKAAR